jgi:hypothetical protein
MDTSIINAYAIKDFPTLFCEKKFEPTNFLVLI